MLQPALVSLIAPCLPAEFTDDYAAYAFLYCMLAIVVMHLFDSLLEGYMMSVMLPELPVTCTQMEDVEKATPKKEGEHSHGGHVHSILLIKEQKIISAYMLEFGVTVHSVFIGLENGIVAEDELKRLLVALCCHQFFEGLALGSRIVEVELPSHLHEVILCGLFHSSPIGHRDRCCHDFFPQSEWRVFSDAARNFRHLVFWDFAVHWCVAATTRFS